MARSQLARAIARPLSITATRTIPLQAPRRTEAQFEHQIRNGSSKAAKDVVPNAHPASLADAKPNNLVDYALYVLNPMPR
ncbi:putative NADH-ubiquinone oxidoreductase 19.3 kDa subunit, mitochondrial precursor [Fusarium bulbicola]|nr:putative NADH-ubiquinone oxidoreductase 19.3 kDa subunit, mitochondrial precursor [Fusarium bulbicola]